MTIQQYASYDHSRVMTELVDNALEKAAPSRYSATLVNQLVYTPYEGTNHLYQFITPEIAHLENPLLPTETKKESIFRAPEMNGLWKKHFTLPCFLAKNLQKSMGFNKNSKNTIFEDTFKSLFKAYVSKPSDEAARLFALQSAETLMNRFKTNQKPGGAPPKKTGEWIIYQQHEGKNYYLCIAMHQQSNEEILRIVNQARKEFRLSGVEL